MSKGTFWGKKKTTLHFRTSCCPHEPLTILSFSPTSLSDTAQPSNIFTDQRWAASASTDGSSRAQTSAFHVAPDLPKQEGAQGVTTLPDLVRCPLPQDVEGPAWHFSLGSMICTLKALTPEAMPLPASLVCGEKEGALPTIDPPDRLQSGGARDTEVLLGVLLLLPFL